jgi:hypothetical protein
MIYFVRCKEATAKESIYAPANAYSLAPSEFSLLVQPGGLHGFNWSSMKGCVKRSAIFWENNYVGACE